ncbi:MAG: acetylornithine deacetylase/succinyl-diaminopimelate desuccinylase-like protein [Halieaceae bacterium]|jgi:acetylornithine deacetylase/succinyl-diaminopimelate desuccinylase-like protein
MTPINVLLISLALLMVQSATAQESALERLQSYIEVDTVNPPGNESRGVHYLAGILDAAGIDYETAESAPGRGNIWARLEGGDEPALILLHHIDVVPASREFWATDPLKAEIRDGKLYGRGTLDTKGLGIAHLEAFLALHISGAKLKRDVIFMATADEEAGGKYGAGWIVDNRPEAFAGAGFLLNEGGMGKMAQGYISFGIEVAQKRPYWLRLTASGVPGHGSRPLPESATSRLIAALARLQAAPFEPRIVAPVRSMFQAMSPHAEPEWQDALLNIDETIKDPQLLAKMQATLPGLHSLTRNTCSLTMLSGSQKINIVPPTAIAELDCRILPDQDAPEFLEQITRIVNDEHIAIEKILLFGAAISSSDTRLFRDIEEVTARYHPQAGILPSVVGGFTDSHFFRDLGITSYGYAPFVLEPETAATFHGNNEHIPIDTFEQGVQMMIEIVSKFAGT